jgi:hypothetical protein
MEIKCAMKEMLLIHKPTAPEQRCTKDGQTRWTPKQTGNKTLDTSRHIEVRKTNYIIAWQDALED